MSDHTQASLDTSAPVQPVGAPVQRYVRVQRTIAVFALHPMDEYYPGLSETEIRDHELAGDAESYDHFMMVSEMVQTVPDSNIDNSTQISFETMTEDEAKKFWI